MAETLDIVVSMTTWAGRIGCAELPRVLVRWLTQRTTARYKVVLVLSQDEFGPNYRLPDTLATLLHNSPKFEVIWTKENTRALKKLDPTMAKYPGVPVITTDDDVVVRYDTVDKLFALYRKYPKTIFGHWLLSTAGVKLVAGLRMFPPNSIVHWPNEWFSNYFNMLHDDEWNGLRARAKGTPLAKMPECLIENIDYGDPRNAFRNEYSRFNYGAALRRFMQEHPEVGLS
jgi:hypothetical protein